MKKLFAGKDLAAILISVLAGTIAVGIIGVSAVMFWPEKTFPMSSFAQSSVEMIDNWAKENSVVVAYDYQYDEEIEKGNVISQNPAEGTTLEKNAKISIVISLGPDPELQIQLPDFTDYTLEDLQKFVEENKLSDVTYEFIYSDKIKEDVYISMNIDDEFVKRNDMIIFTLSDGPETKVEEEVEIVVPDFSTYTRTQINNWASANKVNIKFTTKTSETVKKDEFIEQSVKAGSTVKAKATITVTYSSGEPVKAIDLTGKTKAEVVNWQGSYNNRINITYKSQYSDTVIKNSVISNTPNKDTMADGSTMTVVLSAGKPIITDYATTHKSYDALKAEIEEMNKLGANITLVRSEYVTSTSVKKDCVISQDKLGEVNTGTTVKVSVSSGLVIAVPTNWTTEAEVKAFCATNNLVAAGTSKYDSTVAKDKLISYTKKGQNVAEGETINYEVSLGEFTLGENDVKGKTIAQVNELLNAAKSQGAPAWTLNTSEAYDNTTNYGVGQIFEATISGTTINAKVSKGRSAFVDNYVGENKNGIATTGLVVTFVEEFSDTVAKDIVISQSIAANSVVSAGTAITITVSKGPEVITPTTAQIKAYVSMYTTTADANAIKSTIESELSAAGFTNFSVVLEEDPDLSAAGVVWYQSHKGNQNLDTAITIKIQPNN